VTSLQRWITKAVPATPHERAAALWSFGYFFTLLAGYYVLRPLRDQMGIAGGVRDQMGIAGAPKMPSLRASSVASFSR
jgi:ATP:ADP antiporter, AAA family